MQLFSKNLIEDQMEELDPWQQSAYQHFKTMMSDKNSPYPCVPGIQGFIKDTLRFAFVGDPRDHESSFQLAKALKEYGKISRQTGKYASLVVFFDSMGLPKDTDVSTYQNYFWSILNRVNRLDEAPWPEEIPKNPHHHDWEFCYDGEPYFAFCSTPAHQKRKSRKSPFFTLAFQPRWVFDDINSSTPFGQKLKAVIRKRLVDYDGVPPHPDLKWYGQEDNFEWKQYFLKDDDSSLLRCPFSAMKNQMKNFHP